MAGRFTVEAIFKGVDEMSAPIKRMSKTMGRFTRSAERGLKSVNKGLNKMGAGLKSVAKAGVAGVGALTAGVTLLIREFSKIEDAEAAFTPLLGGAEKAKELVGALNKTAASTPFQFETLAGSANQLLPVMNGNIDNTVKTLRMLGDTAGGNAQKLDSITRGFTKAMLKGKVDMESLNMIAEAGVPIFGDLADVMGVEVNASFFKMISAGKVTTDQLNKAFEKMTSKGGKFFNGMEIASKTTSGIFSTLKDNIGLTAASIGEILAPKIKELLILATDYTKIARVWIENNKELISESFLSFLDAMKTAFLFLKDNGPFILKAVTAFVALSVVLKSLIAILTLVNLVMAANPVVLITLGIMAAVAAVVLLVKWLNHVADKLDIVGRGARFLSDLNPFGDDDNPAAGGRTGATSGLISKEERIAKQINEQRTTNEAELTIKDETGRGEITGTTGPSVGVSLVPSGAF